MKYKGEVHKKTKVKYKGEVQKGRAQTDQTLTRLGRLRAWSGQVAYGKFQLWARWVRFLLKGRGPSTEIPFDFLQMLCDIWRPKLNFLFD